MRILYSFIFSTALIFATSCSNDNNSDSPKSIILTFEDNASDNGATATLWENYIDRPEYGGNMLYSGNGYNWFDPQTTLTSALPDHWGDGTFFGGGIAISDYVENLDNPTYEQQLTINTKPVSGKNFAVCYVATNIGAPYIEFKDGEGIVESMHIISTAYTDAVIQKGNAFSYAMAENGYLRITATGIDAAGNITAVSEFFLYDGRTMSDWRVWSLSELGYVKRIEFRMYEGITENGKRVDSTAEYPNFPFYFAIDDIKVRR